MISLPSPLGKLSLLGGSRPRVAAVVGCLKYVQPVFGRHISTFRVVLPSRNDDVRSARLLSAERRLALTGRYRGRALPVQFGDAAKHLID